MSLKKHFLIIGDLFQAELSITLPSVIPVRFKKIYVLTN